jgi:hypothetical protein
VKDDEYEELQMLEVEVEAEVEMAGSSRLAADAATPPTEWMFDPIDVEREEVGLTTLLGAVEALEDGERP